MTPPPERIAYLREAASNGLSAGACAEVFAALDAANARAEAAEKRARELEDKAGFVVSGWSNLECPACGYDCASANPPIALCPVRAMSDLRALLKGPTP